jgi:hypothetical protein
MSVGGACALSPHTTAPLLLHPLNPTTACLSHARIGGTAASERHSCTVLPRSFIIVSSLFLSLSFDHRLTPRPPAQDDFDKSKTVPPSQSPVQRPSPRPRTPLGTSTISLGRDGLTLVYPFHSVLWRRFVVTDTFLYIF